jgi:hypothetical protein
LYGRGFDWPAKDLKHAPLIAPPTSRGDNTD